jgi:hypothetical protein
LVGLRKLVSGGDGGDLFDEKDFDEQDVEGGTGTDGPSGPSAVEGSLDPNRHAHPPPTLPVAPVSFKALALSEAGRIGAASDGFLVVLGTGHRGDREMADGNDQGKLTLHALRDELSSQL